MNNKDLISQYVDTGVGIPEYQFNQLSNNDKRTYLRKRMIATRNSHGGLPVHQFNWLMSQNNTDLINQYINLTKHSSIPNYQEHIIRDYQFSTGSNKDKLIYIKSEIEDRDNILADVKFEWLLKQNNTELIIEYIKKFNGLPEKQLKKLPNWAIEKYLDNRLIYKEHLGGKIYDYELKYLSNSQKIKYEELLTNGQ